MNQLGQIQQPEQTKGQEIELQDIKLEENQPQQLNIDEPPKNMRQRKSIMYEQLVQSAQDQESLNEDGRETKFYYERYRCLELSRFMLMLIAQGMNILSYDLEFEERDQTANDLISWVIFVSTIMLIIMTVLAHIANLQFEIAAKQVSKQGTLFNTGKIKPLITSIVLYLIFPYPWTSGIEINFTFLDESTGIPRTVHYKLNEILTLIMLIRIIILIQSVLIFSKFAGARPHRVCKFYACKSDGLFICKCMMKKYPMTVFWFLYLACIGIFAFAIRICERPLVREQDEYWQSQINSLGPDKEFHFNGDQDFNSYLVSLWCVFISLPTVGYGDRYPRTTLGRLILTICAIVGAFLFSMLVEALSNLLELTNSEGKSVTVLRKIKAKDNLRNASSKLLVVLGQLKMKVKLGHRDMTKKEVKKLDFYMKEYKTKAVQYKNIQSEFSLYEQLERELEFVRKEFKNFLIYNDQLIKCEELIDNYINSEGSQEPQSCRVGFMDGFEKVDVQAEKYEFEIHENTKNFY